MIAKVQFRSEVCGWRNILAGRRGTKIEAGLARLGIVSPKRMANSRRYAAVVVLIAAAIITPTPDPFNMLFVAAPIYCLYELGLIFAKVASVRAGRTNVSG